MGIMVCVLLLFQRKVNHVKIDQEKRCTVPLWQESLKLMTTGNFLQSVQVLVQPFPYFFFLRDNVFPGARRRTNVQGKSHNRSEMIRT